MSETQDKIKKERVISLVAKLNISKDDLLDFLKRNGIEASVNTTLEPEVVAKVYSHYKKDIEKENKRKEKVKSFEKEHHAGLSEGAQMLRAEEEKKRQIEEEERARKAIEEENKRREDEKRKQELHAYIERKKLEEEEKIKSAARKEKPKPIEARRDKPVEAAKTAPKEVSKEAVKVAPRAPRETPREASKEIPKETPRESTAPRHERRPIEKKPEERKPSDQQKPQDRQPFRPGRPGEQRRPQAFQKKPFQRPQKKDVQNKITLKDIPGKKKPETEFKKPVTPRPPGQASTTDNRFGDKRFKDKDKTKAQDRKKFELEQERKRKLKLDKGHRSKEQAQKEIDDAIRETFAKMDDGGASARSQARKRKKKGRIEEVRKILEQKEATKHIVKVNEYISTSELANLMEIDPSEIIKACFKLGMMVSINQRLEKDLIELIGSDFGIQIEFLKEYEEDILEDTADAPATLKWRSPVVTVMGHVDHGKTSLLDFLRKANVVEGEAGGITQHIGAYKVLLDGGKSVTFLDTPGHEAFTAMRARGGQAADIVVLVVAADDSVMPQTVEAINHARAAGVPIVIAINKVDKPDANPERIKQQLSEKEILVEEWGGKYQSVEISAKHGMNIDKLLEKILVEAELLELKANPDRNARGVVLEAKLDKGKGPIATVLVQKGTLKVGDTFVSGMYSGKVKAMFDERENKIDVALPSRPAVVLGFDGVPQAGDTFVVLDSERDSKAISLKRQQLKREQDVRQVRFITLDDISKQIKEGQEVELKIILKADTDGSAEALADSLHKLTTKETKVTVIHKAVGAISESDILLAVASGAIVIGFSVRPNLNARKLAEKNNIDIRLYDIIYKLIEEVKQALEGMLAPDISEEIVGTVEIRQVFKVPKIGNVAGCYVLDGKIVRNNRVRLIRDGFKIFEGNISSLKRIKDDVREVESGYECGIGLENFNDIKVGDNIESFKLVETKRKLITQ
ncbi:MAG: translation initiation factor IF-2 [Ignavibacteria bacterium]|nr:translation initiation factor IF-2 [Ignavibacteria bacterium]